MNRLSSDAFPGARLCEPQQRSHCQPPPFISCAFGWPKLLRVSAFASLRRDRTDPRSVFNLRRERGCVEDQPQRVVVRKIIGLPDALRLIPLRGTQPLSA